MAITLPPRNARSGSPLHFDLDRGSGSGSWIGQFFFWIVDRDRRWMGKWIGKGSWIGKLDREGSWERVALKRKVVIDRTTFCFRFFCPQTGQKV